MATGKDIETCTRIFAGYAQKKKFDRILLLSPDGSQEGLIRGLYPQATVTVLGFPQYDISKGPPPGKFNMVFLANTMMAAADPELWFSNLLENCEEIWVQDLVRAWRNGDRELSPETGDVMRYTFPQRDELARIDGAFDIDSSKIAEVEDIEFYSDSPASGDKDCRKFVAVIKKRKNHARATGGGADSSAPTAEPGGGKDPAGGGPPRRRPLPA